MAAAQLILLPLQLRVWGQEATSHWFVVLAIANIAGVADLGFRTAGHAQLVLGASTADSAASRYFQQIWAMTRLLVVGSTAVIILGQVLAAMLQAGPGVQLWVCAVTASIGLDTLTVIRGMWLDTLGHFNRVEALFLGMVASRVVLFYVVLTLWQGPPAALAWIMLATGVAALIAQAGLLSRHRLLALTAGGFGRLRWRSLAVVRFVVAEPASNWVRLSLPVLVLSAIATPELTTIYVALRAVFGLSRQVINQLGRYASVSYARSVEDEPAAARTLLVRFTLLATLVSLAVSCAVIADHARLLNIWLKLADPAAANMVAICFAVGAAAYGYQVIAGAMMRTGDVVGVARRQYIYLAVSGAAAAVGYVSGSATLYLVLVAIQELTIAGLFIGGMARRVQDASLAGFAAAMAATLALWLAANAANIATFTGQTALDIGGSAAAAGLIVLLVTACYVGIDGMQRQALQRASAAAAPHSADL